MGVSFLRCYFNDRMLIIRKVVHNRHVIWGRRVAHLRASISGPPALGCWYVRHFSDREIDANTQFSGSIIYIASLIGFILLLLIHLARFTLSPRLIPASIAHPSEGLFVSTFASALGILIIDGATYSHKMHTSNGSALRTFYWIFVLVAVIFGVVTPLAQ